jgi:hypothetical protein
LSVAFSLRSWHLEYPEMYNSAAVKLGHHLEMDGLVTLLGYNVIFDVCCSPFEGRI